MPIAENTMIIAQLSDTHFGTEVPKVVDALQRCLEKQNVDVIILSGDITQRAQRQQFMLAKKFINALPCDNIVAIPGNHDIPLFNLLLRFYKPFRNYQHIIADTLNPVYSNTKLCIIGLNSVNPFKHTDGVISHQQMEQVIHHLETAPKQALKIVVAHHPFAVALQSDHKNRIHNAENAVSAWCKAGLDLILGGHIHYPYVAPLKKHYAGLSKDAWVVQAGTATSSRTRANIPNSFALLNIDDDRKNVCIQRLDYDQSINEFLPIKHIKPWN